MALDTRGEISAFVIAIYVPILIVSFLVAYRHGFSRRAGWVLLVVLSIIRIIGGSMHIAAEETRPISTGLFIGYTILESVGVSPLLVATVGFLGTIKEGAFDGEKRLARGLRLMGILGVVGAALNIGGGSQASATNPNNGSDLRHVGVILYVALYGLILAVLFYFWINKDLILKHRRSLMLGISAAIPFLGIRVLYSVLSSFAPQSYGGQSTTTSALSRFNSSGPFGYWLGMSVLTEIATVIIYMITGLLTPLAKDYTAGGVPIEAQGIRGSDEEMIPRRQWRQ